MTLAELFGDKTIKAKQKVATISQWLLDGSLPIDALIGFAQNARDPEKATCIEALEFSTSENPRIATQTLFAFVTQTLTETAPRVKWESARVVGNLVPLFPTQLAKPIAHLLANAHDPGTVVRWATAYALGEILKLKTKHNQALLPAIKTLCESETDTGVKKKYLDALQKTKQ